MKNKKKRTKRNIKKKGKGCGSSKAQTRKDDVVITFEDLQSEQEKVNHEVKRLEEEAK